MYNRATSENIENDRVALKSYIVCYVCMKLMASVGVDVLGKSDAYTNLLFSTNWNEEEKEMWKRPTDSESMEIEKAEKKVTERGAERGKN